ncbi:MAG: hypothetical protein GXP25_23470 [Planctomycetes bacterium]|nr:hypothetical protein [Planctomycetota bacterium]
MIEGHEVVSDKGAVAAGPPEAARVGAQILEAGGNAMDAASATCLACAMVQPQSTGVAGYVSAGVVLDAKTGKVWSIDSNSIAPAGIGPEMFEVTPAPEGGPSLNEREYFCKVKDDANVHGPLAVGPPGMLAGAGVLHERWGRLKWEQIVAPSQKLLEDGYKCRCAGAVKSLEHVIRRFEPTMKHLMPDGRLPSAGDIWHRPEMQPTLARLAEAGWRDMYSGELGRKIADYIQSIGGVLSREDMAEFEPRVTDPYTITYRNATIHGAILTNGTLSALEALLMLECFEPVPDDTVEYWHRLAEVFKLVWRDRLNYLADPDFVDVPIERILSNDYAMGRTESIRRFPEHVDKRVPPVPKPPGGTLHVSTADAEGNVVSITISQGMAFGSCVTVPDTGLILGHGVCRLDPRPGLANSLGPKKRPLNNTCPILMQLPDRDVAVGLPGGRRIVCVVPRMAHCILEFGASPKDAAFAPRLYVGEAEPMEIQETAPDGIADGLRAMGHEVNVVKSIAGGAHIAEFLKSERKVRAGGNTWAAGVE